MEKEKKSSLRTKLSCKAISPLIISNGFIHGWAYDPLRTEIQIILSVDGVETANCWTGHPVADEFYASTPPPSTNCGFIIPLPHAALDGFSHQLSAKVSEWKSLPLAPEITQEWNHGNTFGEVHFTPHGFIEGWVAFRFAIHNDLLPPVTVTQEGKTEYTIQLVNVSHLPINNCQTMGRFRVPQSQLAKLCHPVFSCLGIELRLQHSSAAFNPIGEIESVDHESIIGWALNTADPSESVDLQLMIDGLPYRSIRPNFRPFSIANHLNLLPEEIGITGFQIDLPAKLKDGRPHSIDIHFRKNGALLNEKPLSYIHRPEGLNLQSARAILGLKDQTINNYKLLEEPTKPKTKKKNQTINTACFCNNSQPKWRSLFRSII